MINVIAHFFLSIKIYLFVAFAMSVCISSADAQGKYPTEKTIRIITPYEPGSAVDMVSRLMAEELKKELGQHVIVENRVGGMGMIAMNALMSAQADGYTLLTDTPASAINPSLYRTKYDPKRDLAPIAKLMSSSFVLAISPNFGIRSARELVSYAKENPDLINAAIAGTSTRLVTELFARQNSIKLNPVFYRGAASAIDSVLKNDTQLILIDVGNVLPHLKDGRLEGLLVTGDQRLSSIKNVPTNKESGFSSFEVTTWFGLFSRAEVPHDIQNQLNFAVRKAVDSPRLKSFMKQREAFGSSMSRAQFKTFFDNEVDKWAQLVNQSGIKLD